MSAYHPPTEDLAIFDPSVFNFNETPLTIGEASNYFLRYPQAQGEEDLQAINVLGTATFDDDIILNKNPTANITATNELTIQNGLTYDLSVSSGNILTLAGNQIFMNASEIINQGSYNQSVERNSTNPTDITTATELMVCSTIGNNLTMLPYTSYYQGFTFKVCNITNSVITLTSADIDFYSWLRGNVGLVYNIQPNSSISGYLLIPAITLGVALWFVRDDFGYKTINTTANSTHYLNFSDSSGTGVGNIQKTAGIECNPNTNTITATTFSGSATGVLTTSDNTNGTYFIPFSKTTAGANTSLYLDDTSGPFTYNPSNGGLTFSIGVCPRYDSSSNTANCSLFGNTTTGNMVIANALTTGSISIGVNAMTSGNITIGTTTATGLVNIRPILTLGRQLRTSILAPTNALDLGVEVVYNASGFANTSLVSNIVANLIAENFTSTKYGTYLFTAQVKINPTATGATRQIQISISTQTGVIQTPYYVETHSFVGGTVGTLFITRTLQIYSNISVTLTALCTGSNANVEAVGNDGLFSYVRIA
jgi:hypothetical protein